MKTKKEKILFTESDTSRYVNIYQSKDGKYLFVNSATKEDNEIWVIDRDDPSSIRLLVDKENSGNAHVDHLRDFFIQITNQGEEDKNFHLLIMKDGEYKWEVLVDKEEGVVVSDYDGFKNFIAVYMKKNGEPLIKIIDLEDTSNQHTVQVGQEGSNSPGLNQNYDQNTLRFIHQSPFIYQQVHEYNHLSKKTQLLKETKLRGSPQIVRNQFECRRLEVPSDDGESIPMYLMHKKGIPLNRKNRTLVEVYGAYGLTMH